jgi:hypothetical protein
VILSQCVDYFDVSDHGEREKDIVWKQMQQLLKLLVSRNERRLNGSLERLSGVHVGVR